LTVIEKEAVVPEQLLALGVTVTVETNAEFPVFTVVNVAIFPVPEAPKPVAVLELVQVYCVPATKVLFVKVMAFERVPAHLT
jgi:hypothetical protein